MLDLGREVCEKALSMGAEVAIVRLQERLYELIVFDNGSLKNVGVSRLTGLSIKVLVNGGLGYSYTSILSKDSIELTIKNAINLAKTLSTYGRMVKLSPVTPLRDSFKVNAKLEPLDVDLSEKISLIRELNTSSLRRDRITSAMTRYGYEDDKRVVVTSEGTEVEVGVKLIGISHTAVAKEGINAERIYDQKSFIGGYEFVKSFNWQSFVDDINDLAVNACRAKTPSPGRYVAIVDNELVGLMIHEVLGHAVEGDTIVNQASILYGMLGKGVGSKLIDVVDEGLVSGGYPVPYDDEGIKKSKTYVIREGTLVNYLSSRSVASELGVIPSGNARAQDITYDVLVRQTNLYVAPGSASLEELFEDLPYGIYLRGRGAMGGEVDPATGTFTFSVGPSYIIKDGELRELIRGVVVSGNILEVLRNVELVGKDLIVKTSVFGGCGKDGQTVRVGNGGPHMRVKDMIVGGM